MSKKMIMEMPKFRDLSTEGDVNTGDFPPYPVAKGGYFRYSGMVMAFFVFMALLWIVSVSRLSSNKHVPVEEFSAMYFVCCFIGGIISGLPHTLLTPIDLVKCRIQVGEYETASDGFKRIYTQAGGSLIASVPHFYRGWVPTFFGYSAQGGIKFFFYELFKYLLLHGRFDAHEKPSPACQLGAYLAASFFAEMLADVALAPWEAMKVKIQTTNVQQIQIDAIVHLVWSKEGWRGFYKGLGALWCRQVPYTVVKFATFEKIANYLYSVLGSTPRSATPKSAQLIISIFAGILAGMLCAVVSHPADTIVSKLNQRADVFLGARSSVWRILRELGWTGIWKGLLPRMLMVGSLTALQWMLYDSFKIFIGLPTTGGGGAGHINKK